jgi:hypothetical protein
MVEVLLENFSWSRRYLGVNISRKLREKVIYRSYHQKIEEKRRKIMFSNKERDMAAANW